LASRRTGPSPVAPGPRVPSHPRRIHAATRRTPSPVVGGVGRVRASRDPYSDGRAEAAAYRRHSYRKTKLIMSQIESVGVAER
jgi:hypothetical protein